MAFFEASKSVGCEGSALQGRRCSIGDCGYGLVVDLPRRPNRRRPAEYHIFVCLSTDGSRPIDDRDRAQVVGERKPAEPAPTVSSAMTRRAKSCDKPRSTVRFLAAWAVAAVRPAEPLFTRTISIGLYVMLATFLAASLAAQMYAARLERSA